MGEPGRYRRAFGEGFAWGVGLAAGFVLSILMALLLLQLYV